MTVSTMLQLKILKTKKRLFRDNPIPQLAIVIAGLFLILSFMLRAVSLSSKFGSIEVMIPQIAFSENEIQTGDKIITSETTVIFLGNENIYFGHLDAFGDDFNNVRNKFLIPHKKGKPDTNRLIADLKRWNKSNKKTKLDVLIYSSSDDIPARIALMTLAEIKRSKLFTHVTIGGGLL